MQHKICVFIQTLQVGGAEKQSILLTKALQEKYDTMLVVWKGDLYAEKNIAIIEQNHIRLIQLRGNYFYRIFTLYRLFNSEKITIVFSFLASTNFYGSIISKLTGINYFIGGIRNSFLPYPKYLIQKFIHNNLSYSTIYNNRSGLNYLTSRGFSERKSFVIHNCFELKTGEYVRTKKNNINIITVARFVDQKNWFTALKAVKVTKKIAGNKNLNIKYYVIGYGELENDIRNYIKEQKMEDYTEVVINPACIEDYYRAADVYLCTSLFEGLSNTILEAMSYSLPIIATDVGDNNYLVRPGLNGYLTGTDDENEISGYLTELVSNYDKRLKFGRDSFNYLKENITYEKFRENYYKFIESLNG